MQLILKSRNVEVPADLKEYTEQKLRDKLATYINGEDPAVVCDVEFQDEFGPKGGVDKRVDITIDLPHRHSALHIEETDTNFKEAVDKLLDRLDQPLERYKETGK